MINYKLRPGTEFDPISLPGEQREILERLARYLWELPRDYEHFDMHSFVFQLDPIDDEQATFLGDIDELYQPSDITAPGAVLTRCGTVACAVGHSLALGLDFDRIHQWLDRHEETHRDRPITWRNLVDYLTDYEDDLALWLFSGTWSTIDNTPRGAAVRIMVALEHGIPSGMLFSNKYYEIIEENLTDDANDHPNSRLGQRTN